MWWVWFQCGGYNTNNMEKRKELIDFLTEIFNDSDAKPSLRFTANKILTSINAELKEQKNKTCHGSKDDIDVCCIIGTLCTECDKEY